MNYRNIGLVLLLGIPLSGYAIYSPPVQSVVPTTTTKNMQTNTQSNQLTDQQIIAAVNAKQDQIRSQEQAALQAEEAKKQAAQEQMSPQGKPQQIPACDCYDTKDSNNQAATNFLYDAKTQKRSSRINPPCLCLPHEVASTDSLPVDVTVASTTVTGVKSHAAKPSDRGQAGNHTGGWNIDYR